MKLACLAVDGERRVDPDLRAALVERAPERSL